MKYSPHFVDLTTISCIIGRVFDQGQWTFVNRSGSMVHVRMASPPSSSQSSDITDFSMSNESDSELVSSSEESPMSVTSLADSTPMNLDTPSTGSSK